MDIQIRTALISLAGIFITVVVSWLTSRLQTKVALKRIYGDFSTKLYEKRLGAYQPLFELTSNLNKALKSKELNKKQLINFFQSFQELDSKTGLYFSSPSIEACHELRQSLIPLLKKDDDEIYRLLKNNEIEKIRREKVQALELALKYEIGVFGFDSPMRFQKSRLFKRYHQSWPISKSSGSFWKI